MHAAQIVGLGRREKKGNSFENHDEYQNLNGHCTRRDRYGGGSFRSEDFTKEKKLTTIEAVACE